MKPVDKFGQPIYSKTYEKMLNFGHLLDEHGYMESTRKPNLFYRHLEDGDKGIIYFADMRGTEEVAVWEDASPLFYWQFPNRTPEWKRRRLIKQELARLPFLRLSYYEECDSDGLMYNNEDGYCRVCGKDFQSNGQFCSSNCALESKKLELRHDIVTATQCCVCHRFLIEDKKAYEAILSLLPDEKDHIVYSSPVKHHVNYAENRTIDVCASCHIRIHRADDYKDFKPNDKPQPVNKERSCRCCRSMFIPSTGGQRYCSSKCKTKAYVTKHPRTSAHRSHRYDGIPWWMRTRKSTDDDRRYVTEWNKRHLRMPTDLIPCRPVAQEDACMTQPNIQIVKVELVTCKNCGSGNVIKKGSYKGVPRYFCHNCERKFKGDDAVFHGKVDAEMGGTRVVRRVRRLL
jgi:hypothetical protein